MSVRPWQSATTPAGCEVGPTPPILGARFAIVANDADTLPADVPRSTVRCVLLIVLEQKDPQLPVITVASVIAETHVDLRYLRRFLTFFGRINRGIRIQVDAAQVRVHVPVATVGRRTDHAPCAGHTLTTADVLAKPLLGVVILCVNGAMAWSWRCCGTTKLPPASRTQGGVCSVVLSVVVRFKVMQEPHALRLDAGLLQRFVVLLAVAVLVVARRTNPTVGVLTVRMGGVQCGDLGFCVRGNQRRLPVRLGPANLTVVQQIGKTPLECAAAHPCR